MLVEKPEGIRRRQVEYARHSSELYKDNHLKSSKTISLSNEGQIQADLQQVQPGLEGTANRSLQVLAFLVVGSIGIRLYYAVTVFSVLHADEFYQALELAHIFTYQYGLLAIEFRPRVAMRSPLMGLFYSMVMHILEAAGCDFHDVIVPGCRAVQAVLTGLLLLPVYGCVRQHCRAVSQHSTLPALTAALLVGGGEYFVHMGTHTISNSFVSPLIFASLWTLGVDQGQGWPTHCGGGICLGVALYIRPDGCVVVAIYGLVSGLLGFIRYSQIKNVVGGFGAGCLGALGLGCAVDRWFYGFWVMTPYNWVSLNIFQGVASIHGTHPAAYYWHELVAPKPGLLLALMLGVVTFWTALVHVARLGSGPEPGVMHEGSPSRLTRALGGPVAAATGDSSSMTPGSRPVAAATLPLLAGVGTMLVYSMLGHKEIRFVHDAMVLLHMALAQALVMAGGDIRAVMLSAAPALHARMVWRGLLGALVGLGALGLLGDSWHTRDTKDWFEFEHINGAIRYVGQQPDATGLVLTGFWWDTAGWTALHRHIPIVYAVDDESLEVQPNPHAMLGYHCGERFPEIFSPTYWEYAKKNVVHNYLKMKKYNYLIMPATDKNAAMESVISTFGFVNKKVLGKANVYSKQRP